MTPFNVLIGCEFSGIVREAFRARGHNAHSVDFLPSEKPGPHHMMDVLTFIRRTPYLFGPLMHWDLFIVHPPCTRLAVSGARWFKDHLPEQAEALEFVRKLMACNIPRIALENPISVISSRIRKPDQIIQPWQFGHGETKATCLWLKNLPPLKPTNIVSGRDNRVHFASPGPNRWKERSRTLQGIADAMADQWGRESCI